MCADLHLWLLCVYRGCTEEYEMKTQDQKGDAEPMAASYRSSQQRGPAWRWDSPPTAPSAQRWTPVGPPSGPSRTHKGLVPVPYREPQHIPAKRSDIPLIESFNNVVSYSPPPLELFSDIL